MLTMGCRDEVTNNKYCKLPARFSFNPVNSISQLYSSCESQGEWCSIVLSNQKLYFTKCTGSQGVANLTALSGYTGFYMGLCGFIVGKPFMNELGYEYPVITCYDLACPNCYQEQTVTRKLTLLEGGLAICKNGSNPCHRTYNLENQGIVIDGKAGRALYRYRVLYGNNTLSVNN